MVRYDLNLFEVWKPIPGYKNYEDNKEKQLEKQKIRYQNKKKIV